MPEPSGKEGNMNIDSFIADVKEMLQMTEEAVPETRLEGKDWWDSMAYLYIITYAEEKLGLDVSFEELKPAATLGELYSVLESKA